MLTIEKELFHGHYKANGTPMYYIEGSALNDDVLPTDVENGSTIKILDVTRFKVFDAENNIWRIWE